ncbi:MAG: hypothetical protein RLZZ399_2665 [Verrucomicrobiota bacterium]|jgi:hypothetical protein
MKANSLSPSQKAALELLCMVIHREAVFQKWFRGLLACPLNLRTSLLLQMTTEMRRNREDEDLIGAVSALCDPAFCEAAAEAVRSLS